NHRIDTPGGTGYSGRSVAGGCNEDPSATPPKWELSSNSVAGVWSTGSVSFSGSAQGYGSPSSLANQAGFYAGPWELMNMTSSDFWNWMGSPQSSFPASPSGITYLDNDGITMNASGVWFFDGSGTGFLFVDGDLAMNGNWRGIIY